MADDLVPVGDFLQMTAQPNIMGQTPLVRGRKKKSRYTSKAKVQEVVGDFVNFNSHKLQQWLDEIYVEKGASGAYFAFLQLMEFALPKLQRREITGADEGPVELKVSWMDGE